MQALTLQKATFGETWPRLILDDTAALIITRQEVYRKDATRYIEPEVVVDASELSLDEYELSANQGSVTADMWNQSLGFWSEVAGRPGPSDGNAWITAFSHDKCCKNKESVCRAT